MTKKKQCFVICPIGKEGSKERKRSDQLLKHIIKKVAEKSNFQIIRSDKIGKSGMITTQIINLLLTADLVIADLAGLNPNVFYELGIRHAADKPVILIHSPEDQLPFDISVLRSIKINHKDLDSAEAGASELEKQIETIIEDPDDWTSPVSHTVDLQKLKTSDDLVGKGISDIITNVQLLRSEIISLQENLSLLPHSYASRSIFEPSLPISDFGESSEDIENHSHLGLDDTPNYKVITSESGPLEIVKDTDNEEE